MFYGNKINWNHISYFMSQTKDLCITPVPLELQNKDPIPGLAEAGFQQWSSGLGTELYKGPSCNC